MFRWVRNILAYGEIVPFPVYVIGVIPLRRISIFFNYITEVFLMAFIVRKFDS